MTGIEASSTTQAIAVLIASVLYVATYLSFVHLLRYPRNWHPLSLPESLATGILAALMVVLVSVSPNSIDRPALATMVGFVGVMFTIIAAPAIAFRPTSRLVEFLAKHGDHAGLWLLGPAIVVGLTVPNIKLQAVLATAMAIELTWFLRQRLAGRRRRQYLLTDRDLSVLETQAKGDLSAFRQRHNISELDLSAGAVRWRGCGKMTPPCPFNLYVNRLGLNTAPCCREHMKDLRVRPETLCRITEFSEHASNGRELDEGERVAVEVLPVLGQSAAAVEPGDGAFDHPTPGLDDEALHPIGSLDDLGLEIGQDAGQGAVKDRALIGAVGEQFPEKGKQTEQGRQQRETAVAILNVGGGDDAVQQQALRIDQNMPLLALDQLAGIEAVAVDASPPFSALFTL